MGARRLAKRLSAAAELDRGGSRLGLGSVWRIAMSLSRLADHSGVLAPLPAVLRCRLALIDP